MALSGAAIVGSLGALGFLAWAVTASAEPEVEEEPREIWLTTGTQYSLLISEPNVTSLDNLGQMLTSMGFIVQEISPMPPGGLFQVIALWNQQNTLWQVPENVSISAV